MAQQEERQAGVVGLPQLTVLHYWLGVLGHGAHLDPLAGAEAGRCDSITLFSVCGIVIENRL